jgi:two-component system response regulator FixJ
MSAPPTIFVVDDDDAVRDSLRLLLQAHGYTVAAFASGDEFLERAPVPGRGCCLLIDVRMPGRSGLDVQEELRRAGNPLPVIIMTGHGDVPLAVRAMKGGAVDFIEKPFTEETILNSIGYALGLAADTERRRGPSAEIEMRLDLLTEREREVFQAVVTGRQNKVIAYELGISPRTVEIYRANLMNKMQAGSLSELVRMALVVGILGAP